MTGSRRLLMQLDAFHMQMQSGRIGEMNLKNDQVLPLTPTRVLRAQRVGGRELPRRSRHEGAAQARTPQGDVGLRLPAQRGHVAVLPREPPAHVPRLEPRGPAPGAQPAPRPTSTASIWPRSTRSPPPAWVRPSARSRRRSTRSPRVRSAPRSTADQSCARVARPIWIAIVRLWERFVAAGRRQLRAAWSTARDPLARPPGAGRGGAVPHRNPVVGHRTFPGSAGRVGLALGVHGSLAPRRGDRDGSSRRRRHVGPPAVPR